MEIKDILKHWSLFVGLIAMLLLVFGTLVEGGSQLQKLLFVIGAPTLGVTAYVGKQKMFTVLQLVATIGAALSFFQDFSAMLKYGLMGAIAILSLFYLIRARYFDIDKWGMVGAIGLISIAVGFATNPISSPFLFGVSLGIGGLLVAVYSAIQFFHYKIRIAFIWVILNIIFSIKPLLLLIK